MKESIEIEKMKKERLNESVEVFISTFSKEPWNDVYKSKKQVIDFFENHFNNNYFLGYVLTIDKKICGLSLGMKKPWINGIEYYIDQFCINYDLQNRGLGSKFLKMIEVELKKEGINGIILNTEIEVPAFKFYKKNGLKSFEELRIMGKTY